MPLSVKLVTISYLVKLPLSYSSNQSSVAFYAEMRTPWSLLAPPEDALAEMLPPLIFAAADSFAVTLVALAPPVALAEGAVTLEG